MGYQVLARKWRPHQFSQMVGQQHVIRLLTNALDQNRLHHAYLLTGTRGVGKTTLARILAKAFNCETGLTSQPCGKCAACRDIDAGTFIDLLEVDAASRTKVEQTRELLDNVPYAATRGRFKVYLIDEVHMFSESSFNALLKTLEEPPEHVKFLLATTDPQKIPITVLSRCLQLNLRALQIPEIQNQLQLILKSEQITAEERALYYLAHAANGSMRDGLSLLDQAIAYSAGEITEKSVLSMLGAVGQDRILVLLEAIATHDPHQILQQTQLMAESALDFQSVLSELIVLLQQVTLAQSVPETLDNQLEKERLAVLAQKIKPEEIQLYYQIALLGQRDLPLTPDPRGGLEMILFRMLTFCPDNTTWDVVAMPVQTEVATQTPMVEAVKEPSKTIAQAKIAPIIKETFQKSPSVSVTKKSPQPSEWSQVVSQLHLTGLNNQLALHCICKSWKEHHVILQLDPSYAMLSSAEAKQKIQQALSDYAGHQIKLDIQYKSELSAQTPAKQIVKKEQQNKQDAVVLMQNDPIVKALKTTFNGEIIEKSIKPN